MYLNISTQTIVNDLSKWMDKSDYTVHYILIIGTILYILSFVMIAGLGYISDKNPQK